MWHLHSQRVSQTCFNIHFCYIPVIWSSLCCAQSTSRFYGFLRNRSSTLWTNHLRSVRALLYNSPVWNLLWPPRILLRDKATSRFLRQVVLSQNFVAFTSRWNFDVMRMTMLWLPLIPSGRSLTILLFTHIG